MLSRCPDAARGQAGARCRSRVRRHHGAAGAAAGRADQPAQPGSGDWEETGGWDASPDGSPQRSSAGSPSDCASTRSTSPRIPTGRNSGCAPGSRASGRRTRTPCSAPTAPARCRCASAMRTARSASARREREAAGDRCTATISRRSVPPSIPRGFPRCPKRLDWRASRCCISTATRWTRARSAGRSGSAGSDTVRRRRTAASVSALDR